MIQHKLAEMAIRIFASDTISWRVVGQIEAQLQGFSWDQPDAAKSMLKAVEEYAIECSIVKVFASEVLDYVVDEGVQIHGGYGYHQDYAVERAYRDSRINRIFEGTNEINRLLVTGMLLKRAQRGQLGLVPAAQAVMAEILGGGPGTNGSPDEETRLVRNAKKIALMLMGVAYQKYLAELEKQQEILAGITDVVMECFAMESVLLRARKLAESGRGAVAADMASVYLRDAMSRIEVSSRTVLAACSEGDGLRANMAVLRKFARFDPVDAIAIRRRIAGRLLEAERYLA
jgi:hypothetical protein